MNKLYSNFAKADKFLEGNVSIYLDLIRGISAILVVMEHLSSRLFVGYGNVENPNLLVQGLYLLNILGGPSVIIFFVLSGLFISRSVLKAVLQSKWTWESYLINRLSRLLVVLIPALILTFILDSIAMNLFNYQGYETLFENSIEFVGNLFFLQNIFVGVYGSNAPLWSLSYEFWYYMLFPLIFLLFTKQKIILKVFYLMLAVLIISTIGTRMNSYFVIWLIGVAVLFFPRVSMNNRKLILISSLFLLLVSITVRPLVMTGRLFTNGWTEDLFFADLFVGLSFGLFIYTLVYVMPNKLKRIELKRFGKFSRILASFSFSLYLIHYPIINTVYGWGAMKGYNGLQPSIVSFGIELVLVTILCIIAYYFSRFTEAKTSNIRKFVISLSLGLRKKVEIRKGNIAG
ncbi:acyltransferase family protein [Fredinandcohnia sp. 179-A 10B2 NHS]|uniref:acyltransferase family protein n=1 Tax=Fredinandcohnia sp. 179-A 10B2 NHS TaxID=3235176 RepID=UPI0039A14871